MALELGASANGGGPTHLGEAKWRRVADHGVGSEPSSGPMSCAHNLFPGRPADRRGEGGILLELAIGLTGKVAAVGDDAAGDRR